jgi:hypothetical protein
MSSETKIKISHPMMQYRLLLLGGSVEGVWLTGSMIDPRWQTENNDRIQLQCASGRIVGLMQLVLILHRVVKYMPQICGGRKRVWGTQVFLSSRKHTMV